MEILIYQLKVGALIAVFYMCYRLLLAHETLHRLNRVVLLATVALAFVLPLCVITMHRTVTVAAPAVTASTALSGVVTTAPAAVPLWPLVGIITFWTGFALTLGYTLLSLGRVIRLIATGERHPQQDGTVIVVTVVRKHRGTMYAKGRIDC